MTTRKNIVVALGLGAYLLGFGILSGMAYERIRFDRQRAAVLAEHDRAVRTWHALLMTLEKREVIRDGEVAD